MKGMKTKDRPGRIKPSYRQLWTKLLPKKLRASYIERLACSRLLKLLYLITQIPLCTWKKVMPKRITKHCPLPLHRKMPPSHHQNPKNQRKRRNDQH